MPTGYTHGIYDGTMTSAKEFLLNYARRFGIGYFITKQGELSMPKKYSPELAEKAISNYYTERLEEARRALEAFNNLSENELKAKYNAYVSEKQKENEERTKDVLVRKQRYLDMIERINKWLPPFELEEMKSSAIAHLKESEEFDCKLYLDDISTYDNWIKAEREHLIWNVNYYTEEKINEDKRRIELDTLLKAFYKSLENVE